MAFSIKQVIPVPIKRAVKKLLGMQTPKPVAAGRAKSAKPASGSASAKKASGGGASKGKGAGKRRNRPAKG